jgi:hypothetical protein
MVYFVYQFDWIKDAQIAGETLFLGVFVKMFLEEISIGTDSLN